VTLTLAKTAKGQKRNLVATILAKQEKNGEPNLIELTRQGVSIPKGHAQRSMVVGD
jgi:hypothetical protein